MLRSYLFTPGNNQGLLEKGLTAGADAVVLDLEDSVPEAEKERGREAIARAINSEAASSGACKIFVRINGLGTQHWRADIDAVVGPRVTGLRVPKTENIQALCRLHDVLLERERALGVPSGSIKVVATIETARGLDQMESLSRAPRLIGFTFGAADFCADVTADPREEAATIYVRSRLVAASRAARLLPPIASVFTRLGDDEGLREDTLKQRHLGFFGRSAIHPRQVPIIHSVFDPTAADVAFAQSVIESYEAALAKGSGATRIDGDFVDLAVVRRAQATMELHERARRNRQ